MIHINTLNNLRDCKRKAYLSGLGYSITNNRNTEILKCFKEVIQKNMSLDNAINYIKHNLNNKYFLTSQERNYIVEIIITNLTRYYEYLSLQGEHEILNIDVKDIIDDISIKTDLVIKYSNKIEMIKIKVAKPTLSYKARKYENSPNGSIELYLMKKLGEKLYNNYKLPIVASYHHMTGKYDKESIFIEMMENKNKLINKVYKLQQYYDELPFETTKTGKQKKSKLQKSTEKEIKEISDVLYYDNRLGNNIISVDDNCDVIKIKDEIICSKFDLNNLTYDCEKNISIKCNDCYYKDLCCYEDKKEIEYEKINIKKSKDNNQELKLTNNQQKVVDCENGTFRINAVAGSGKSTTVVKRMLKLLNNCNPSDILMITFTDKGAAELKEKIIKLSNNKKIYDLNVCTFNGFGNQLMANEWQKLGFIKKPELATKIDLMNIIKVILAKKPISWLNNKLPLADFPHYKGSFVKLLEYFDLIKSFNYDRKTFKGKVIELDNKLFDKYHNLTSTEVTLDIFNAYDEFNKILLENNLVQYQDQIRYILTILKNNPNKYGYKHIIVDEYQDTDFMQVDVLKELIKHKEFQSLMVIGDDFQSIYGFRNCTSLNILNFDKEFDNVIDINLLDNFRSSKQICGLANHLISFNEKKMNKKLISSKDGEKCSLNKYSSLISENTEIVKLIKKDIENGIPLEEIAYISRGKKNLVKLKKLLDDENIPSIISASEFYINDNDVKGILALANYFKDSNNKFYLLKFVNCIKYDDNIKLKVDKYQNDIETMMLKIDNEIKCSEIKEKYKIQYFLYLIDILVRKNKIANDFMINLLESKSFYSFTQFISYLHEIDLYCDDTQISKDDTKYKAVTLTTAHSSKGKEWISVYVSLDDFKYEIGDEEKDSIYEINKKKEQLEEERRLLFVAITRAKENLCITTIKDKANVCYKDANYHKFVNNLLCDDIIIYQSEEESEVMK